MNLKKYFFVALPTREESYFIKILAMVMMTMDHIGLIFFPGVFWLRIMGRLAFPLFAYQFGVSINKTHHFDRMGKNLFFFALISQPIYGLVINNGNWRRINIFATLFIAWLIIFIYKKINKNIFKILLFLPILVILGLPLFKPSFTKVDAGLYGVLILIFCTVFAKNPIRMNLMFIFLTIGFCLITLPWTQAFCLLSIPLFYIRIPFKQKIPNLLYYSYYPLHLTIIAVIAKILNK